MYSIHAAGGCQADESRRRIVKIHLRSSVIYYRGMILLHTSDLHLCDPSSEDGARRFKVFSEICEKAKDADVLILAGDVFHSGAEAGDRALQDAVAERLELLAPRPVLMIPGNHEHLRLDGRSLYGGRSDFGRNVVLFNELPFQRFAKGRFAFYGFPFQAGASTSELLGALPEPGDEFRIAILHGTVTGRPECVDFAYDADGREEGGDLFIDLDDLIRGGFRYAALGHIHKRMKWRLGENSWAAYPGSPDAVTVKEEEPRSVNRVEIDELTGGMTVKEVALETATRRSRKVFFALPGREHEVFESVRRFIEAEGDGARPVAYIEGLARAGMLDEKKDELLRAFPDRGVIVKLRAKILEEDAGESDILRRFLAKMGEESEAADSDAQKARLAKVALMGWLALKGDSLEGLLDEAL